MRWLGIIFWICVAGVAYAYVVYPLLLVVGARLWRRAVHRAPFAGRVSIVVSAHNEENRIATRRSELAAMLRASGLDGEVIIVSDGSTDRTAAVAAQDAPATVRVIDLKENLGKAQALSTACAAATGDVIVFADVRQHWAADAMSLLLENFADTTIGGASGDLCLESAPGAVAGVGLYWRYEKAVRKLESRIQSSTGATGAISAVRRELFRPIPSRTILDDVYWPMQVVMQGFRVVHDGRAQAFDRLPDKPRDEFRRKVRTLSGNFQLITRLPTILLPGRNPIWFQFLSHKLFRLAVPWLLLGMLGASAVAPGIGYRLAFFLQIFCYLIALAAMRSEWAKRFRLASVAASFVVLNAAAWMGFWVWVFGRVDSSWRKVHYAPSAPGTPDPSTAGV